MTAPSIVDVVLDPRFINDVNISAAQLTALKACYGLPFATGEELELYCSATGKKEYKPVERREAVFIIGRRGGKDDKLAANIAIYEAFFRTHKLSRGERGVVLLLAATVEQARICFSYILGKIESSAVLFAKVENVRTYEIDLTNGITIAVLPANYRTIRGRSVVCAICSEIAFWLDSATGANPSREILRALRPSMSTFPNAKLILISSPYAKQGVLWDYYQKRNALFGGGGRLVWKMDSLTMNPSLDAARLKEEEQSDPENYAREYMAQFWESAAAFLSADAIDACVVAGRAEIQPYGQRLYTFALDAAFRGDNFAFAGVHREADVVVQDVERCWRGSRAQPVDLASVLDEIAGVMKAYGAGVIYGDQFCSEPIRQALRTRGIRFEQRATMGAGAQCFNSLRTLVTSKKILLLDSPETLAELKQLQIVVTSGGNQRVQAQTGHDDRAVALALAAHESISARVGEPWVEVLDISAPAPGEYVDRRGDLNDAFNDCGFALRYRPSFGRRN